MLKKIVILIISSLIVSCGDNSKKTDPVIPLVKAKASVAIGYNFKTGKPNYVNTLNGQKLETCNSTINQVDMKTDKNLDPQYNKETIPLECEVQLIALSGSPLAIALESSREIIKGTVLKGGKEIPARFLVQVTALHEGSDCTTSGGLGTQVTNCTTAEDLCAALPPGIPGC